MTGIDEALVAALVKAAGLERAMAEFPEDVFAAVAQVFGQRDIIRFPTAPDAEPWPPMRPGLHR